MTTGLTGLRLDTLATVFAICRLGPGDTVPAWATRGTLSSVTRTPDELSIVCPSDDVPPGVTCSRGWRALRLNGPLDLSLVGILSSIAAPLAEAGVSLFALSTHDTDYVLVRQADLVRAVSVLSARGHRIEPTT